MPGSSVSIGARRFRSIPVTHSVPAVGYLVEAGGAAVAFSGDTTTTGEFWRMLNACESLRAVLIETSFTDEEEALSRLSGHLCPRLLAAELQKLTRPVPVYITHLMPGEEEAIMAEIRHRLPERELQPLQAGMVFEF